MSTRNRVPSLSLQSSIIKLMNLVYNGVVCDASRLTYNIITKQLTDNALVCMLLFGSLS